MKKRLVPLLLSLSVALAGAAAASAFGPDGAVGNTASFIVAADEGYGIDTCLGEGDKCGQDIADSWCLANGYVHAVAVRKAEAADLAANARITAHQMGATLITCEK